MINKEVIDYIEHKNTVAINIHLTDKMMIIYFYIIIISDVYVTSFDFFLNFFDFNNYEDQLYFLNDNKYVIY